MVSGLTFSLTWFLAPQDWQQLPNECSNVLHQSLPGKKKEMAFNTGYQD